MAAIETPQERPVVVTVVGGDRIASSHQLGDLTMLCHSQLDLPPGFIVRRIRFDYPEHVGERVNQFLSKCPMPSSDQLELLLRLSVETGNALREHFGQVVASLDLGALDQTQQQRVALRWRNVLELSGVQHLRLGGKVADLGRSEPRKERTLVAEHF